jgi:hypothetical protein
MKATLLSIGLLGCFALGCSSNGGSGGNGNTPNGDPNSCSASGELSGGVTHVIGDQPACSGTDTSAAVIDLLGDGTNLFGGGSIGFTVEFVTPPALDQTGPASISRVTVREVGPQPEDNTQSAESFEWEFPNDACTLDIQSTVLDENPNFQWLWFYAEGSCSGSAEAVAPNTKAPVALSDFAMNAFVTLP